MTKPQYPRVKNLNSVGIVRPIVTDFAKNFKGLTDKIFKDKAAEKRARKAHAKRVAPTIAKLQAQIAALADRIADLENGC